MVVVCDFGWVGIFEVFEWLEVIFFMFKWFDCFNGYFFNWYDMCDFRIFVFVYVFFVDSGNFVGYLIVFVNVCEEWVGMLLVEDG